MTETNQTTTENTPCKCPHCGASMKKYWHRISKGTTVGLIKAYNTVRDNNKNKFNLTRDLTGENKLTISEQVNWSILRFHGLVAKVKENGQIVGGYWLITKRGADYLSGKIQIPKRVQTWRNHVVDHDTRLVGIMDVMKEHPTFDQDFDYSLFEPKQLQFT